MGERDCLGGLHVLFDEVVIYLNIFGLVMLDWTVKMSIAASLLQKNYIYLTWEKTNFCKKSF